MNVEIRTCMDRKSPDAFKAKSEDNFYFNTTKPKSDFILKRRNSFDAPVNEFNRCRSYLDDKDPDHLKYELLWLTHINQRHPDHFRRLQNFNTNVRAILIDWMMEVCSMYRMQRVTFQLAMDYLDRYVGRTEVMPTKQFQLLGITCIFTAAKLMEVCPPVTTELASLTDGAYKSTDIKMVELEILNKLQWDMLPKTLNYWLCRYLSRWCNLIRLRNKITIFPKLWEYVLTKACLIIDLCSLDDGIVQYPYSYTVAAIIFYILSPDKAYYVSGLTYEQLKSCLSWMAPFIAVANQELLAKFFHINNDQSLENIQITNDFNIEFVEPYNVQTHYVHPVLLQDVHNFRELQEYQERKAKREREAMRMEDHVSLDTHSLNSSSNPFDWSSISIFSNNSDDNDDVTSDDFDH